MHNFIINLPDAPPAKAPPPSRLQRIRKAITLKLLIFSVLAVVAVGVSFITLYEFGRVRYVYFGYLLVAGLLTWGICFDRLRALQNPPKEVGEELLTAQMKWKAEVAAALTLLSLIGPFYKYGADYEHHFVPQQQEIRLRTVMNESEKVLSPGYCASSPERGEGCEAVSSALVTLLGYVKDGEEASATTTIVALSRLLGSDVFGLPGSDRRGEVDELVAELKNFQNPQDDLTKLLMLILPILSLLSGCFAISWKVALATHDLNKRQRARVLRPGVAYHAGAKTISTVARVDNPWR